MYASIYSTTRLGVHENNQVISRGNTTKYSQGTSPNTILDILGILSINIYLLALRFFLTFSSLSALSLYHSLSLSLSHKVHCREPTSGQICPFSHEWKLSESKRPGFANGSLGNNRRTSMNSLKLIRSLV